MVKEGLPNPPPPLNFLAKSFSLELYQLPNAFAQLFFDNEHIFWH